MKKLISIFLSVVMLFTLSVPAFAANNSTSLENATETAIEDLSDASNLAAVSSSAGLAWGPVTIGNVKLYIDVYKRQVLSRIADSAHRHKLPPGSWPDPPCSNFS